MARRRTAPPPIRLSEAGSLPGMTLADDLGPLAVEVPVAAFRGMIGTGRAAEEALRREAATRGATHVLEVRIALRQRLWGIAATAHGRAVVLCDADGPEQDAPAL